MGFFEFLTRGKSNSSKNVETAPYKKADEFSPSNGNIEVFKPTSFDEVARIIDKLLEGKPAIVHLTDVRETTAQRVIDLLSGAVYALGGGVCEVQKEVFMFSPDGVEIK